jgi:hypothetical protein
LNPRFGGKLPLDGVANEIGFALSGAADERPEGGGGSRGGSES